LNLALEERFLLSTLLVQLLEDGLLLCELLRLLRVRGRQQLLL